MENNKEMTNVVETEEIIEEQIEGLENVDLRVLCEIMIKELATKQMATEPGTKEWDAITAAINAYGKIASEQFRYEADAHDKEQKFYEEQKRFKIDRIINILSTVASVGVAVFGIKRTLRFETENVITTKAFPMVQKLFPKITK